jgi:nucleotide-binding universal stress UspA family protein
MGWLEMALPILKAAAALTVGLSVGLITDVLVHRIHRRAEVLVIALTAVFFCGGLATYLGLSPLLAGVAAGFMVVNRDRRDVRVFRALNDFEPPIYGVFFALAGAQFHLEELLEAGWIGATFVLLRMVAKAGGAWAGARSGGMEPDRARILGLGLFSQAGLAIGLAYLVAQDPLLESIRSTVLNVVVASVVINELVGPPLVRWVALRTGEAEPDAPSEHDHPSPVGEVDVVRWSWRKLEAPPRTEGAVIAGLHHPATAEAVTRVAVLLSHHYGAMPVALRVVSHELPSSLWGEDDEPLEVLVHAEREAETMGYELHSEVEPAQDVAEGLLRAIRAHGAKALVLGHPEESRAHAFGRIVDAVAARASCPIVVARFVGTLHTERILVPVTGEEGFVSVLPVVQALAAVAEHQVQVLYLIPPDSGDAALSQAREELTRWLIQANLPGDVDSRAIATDSRVHTIVTEAERTDIVVMATGQQKGLRRTFFGSLAEDVAVRSSRTVLLVHRPLQ